MRTSRLRDNRYSRRVIDLFINFDHPRSSLSIAFRCIGASSLRSTKMKFTSKQTKSEVVDAIEDIAIAFHQENRRPAEAVHLTPEIRKKIESLTNDDIGEIASAIFEKGIEKALPTIFGLKILSWDSDSIKVE